MEKLILQIMKEAKANGEPVTREEAEQMAQMEMNDKKNRRYEQSDKPRAKQTRVTKKDQKKIKIIQEIFNFLLTNGYQDVTILNEQREITFGDYSLTLTKHRKKAR